MTEETRRKLRDELKRLGEIKIWKARKALEDEMEGLPEHVKAYIRTRKVHGMDRDELFAFWSIREKHRWIREGLLELGYTSRKDLDPETGKPIRVWDKPEESAG